MEELLEYRKELMNGLFSAPDELAKRMQTINDPFQPLEPGGWNAHQVIVHMRDVNREVYIPRLKRILAEDDPLFVNFDGEAWMAAHYQVGEPLKDLLADFSLGCRSTADLLSALPASAWNRTGNHPTLGRHALQWWAERLLAHITEHLQQISKHGGAK